VRRSDNWQDHRREAHRAGRHSRPQVDCQLCWNDGHFPDIEKLREQEKGILTPTTEEEELDPYVNDGNPDREWMSHR
jgi:hypothetical protein